MRSLYVLLMLVLFFCTASGQTYQFESLDNSVSKGFWDLLNMYNNQGSATAKMDFLDISNDKKDGAGSLEIDYNVGAGDGWGGYVVRTSLKPLPYTIDISAGTSLSFWYKVTEPIVMSKAGTAFLEFKISDIQDGKEDMFFRQMPLSLADASGIWKQVTVDMNIGTDKTVSWAPQQQNGDGELQLDMINGFEIAIVYIPTDGGSATNTPTANGKILLDAMTIAGDKYPPPLVSFENMAADFSIDNMDWAGTEGKGKVDLVNENVDKVEGTNGVLKMDYTCNASQDWGGFVAFEKSITPPSNFIEKSGLTIFLKNLNPCITTVPKRVILRILLFEDNGEQWITKVPIDLTVSSVWTRYLLPLKQLPYSAEGDQYPPTGGFGLTPNGSQGNSVFNPDKITRIRFEIFAIGVGPDAGAKGEKLVGTLLFGIMQQSGYKIYDIVPPLAPGITVITATKSNLITWIDLINETSEKYNIYSSDIPFTSISETGVELIGTNIARGIQVFEHLLRTPKTDKTVDKYYAINAIDKAGNAGAYSFSSKISNMAQGIPIIHNRIINFAADGNLNEWSGIEPFKLYPSNGSGTVVSGFKVNDDTDLSCDGYLAIDNEYLYTAFNVNDDVVFDDNQYYMNNNRWALDCVQLQIGLYDKKNLLYTTYQRGEFPDYNLQFNKQQLSSEHWSSAKTNLLLPGTNYYWQEKFPSGYVVEAKIKLSDLANLRDNPNDVKDIINIQSGIKIPFDIVLNDNDGKNSWDIASNREGLMSWSPYNQNQGWYNPSVWMYSWLESPNQNYFNISADWNLISIPLILSDMLKGTIFKNSISDAYEYSGRYTSINALQIGKGYWIRYANKEVIPIFGQENPTNEITLNSDWNLIGVLNNSVPVTKIITAPTNIINTNFYGYSNGYIIADTLKAGKGYWVRTSEAGKMILPSGITKSSMQPRNVINKNWNKIIIQDSKAGSVTLYLSRENSDLSEYTLPPSPPNGIFDVRWTSDRIVESANANNEIELSSAAYPITLRLEGSNIRIKDKIDGKIVNQLVRNGERLTISDSAIERLEVELEEIPTHFELFQNYPNPFNPTTKIKFALPQNGRTRLTIYNALGEKVEELVNKEMEAGYHEVEWNASRLSSGVYFYEIGSNGNNSVKKMLMIK